MQELCILCGSHKTRTTPYHPESDGMVERFNRTLLMMLTMFAGKNREDWDDLLPAVMMAYRSSVHESTGFSPYRLMFGEECTLPMDIGLPLIAVPIPVESQAVRIDSSCVIHPFYIHKMDSGPVRLTTIAHAFNYRVAVLRDGVRSAVRVGRSRKAETCFLKDVNISWGQQVTVMFQIVSTLMEEVPAFTLRMRELQGESPNVQLMDDPWGHVEHCVAKCACQQSD